MVAAMRRVVGLDLGGVTQRTTGVAALEGSARPRLCHAELIQLSRSTGDREAENRLVETLARFEPEVLAIDAPLTLPPCMSCAAHCPGPGVACLSGEAHRCWAASISPVSQRRTEAWVRGQTLGFRPPMATMQLGVITARAVAMARRLRNDPPPGLRGCEVIEVYPAATLHTLGRGERPDLCGCRPGEEKAAFYARVVRELEREIDGLAEFRDVLGAPGHVFDALVAAYTGWLHADGRTVLPAAELDLDPIEHGWIYLPA